MSSYRCHKKDILFEMYLRRSKDVSKKSSLLRCFWEVSVMSLSMEIWLRSLRDISCRLGRPILYRNQSIDLLFKSMDWFLYDICYVMKELNKNIWAENEISLASKINYQYERAAVKNLISEGTLIKTFYLSSKTN